MTWKALRLVFIFDESKTHNMSSNTENHKYDKRQLFANETSPNCVQFTVCGHEILGSLALFLVVLIKSTLEIPFSWMVTHEKSMKPSCDQ